MKIRLLAILAMPMLLMTTALWADKPFHNAWTDSFDDLNPCTGELNTLTIYIDEYVHFHPNNEMYIQKRSGETSSGYYLVGGHYTLTGNYRSAQIKESINDTWVSGDGSAFKVQYMIIYNWELGEARMEHFRFECLDD